MGVSTCDKSIILIVAGVVGLGFGGLRTGIKVLLDAGFPLRWLRAPKKAGAQSPAWTQRRLVRCSHLFFPRMLREIPLRPSQFYWFKAPHLFSRFFLYKCSRFKSSSMPSSMRYIDSTAYCSRHDRKTFRGARHSNSMQALPATCKTPQRVNPRGKSLGSCLLSKAPRVGITD